MAIVPGNRKGQLEFWEAHIDDFQEHAAEIGLDPLAVANWVSEVQAARAAFTDADAARNDSRGKTQLYYNAVDAMNATGRDFIKQIKLEVSLTGNTDIWGLANIPAPKVPAELKGTPAPTNFKVVIDAEGTVNLAWEPPSKDAFAGKTFYIIERSLQGSYFGQPDVNWVQYDVSNDRKYTDSNVPTGWARVLYRVRTDRNGFRSKSSSVEMIFFGTGAPSATGPTITTLEGEGDTIAEAA